MSECWKDEVEIELEPILEALGINPSQSELERMYRGERRFQRLIGYIIDLHHEEIEELAKDVYEEIKSDSESEEESEEEEEEEEDD